jgi:putative membrane protein
MIWAQTLFYPVYKTSDAARGLNPLSDQNLAGAAMMIEQMFLTILLLGWLFLRFARQDDERQGLLDLAAGQGVALSDERAVRAVNAGAGPLLRERLLAQGRTVERSPERTIEERPERTVEES